MKNASVIIGTAGHVDHGKTTLIKALTGVDTDRLEEEKERKLSIDLGFAPFKLPGGRVAGVIDVPGHEKFMRNMLAGVGGVDLVLLVVDAQEGIMPQTIEHLDVLKILSIDRGIIVLTKADLVEEEWLELMKEEIRERLSSYPLGQAPIVPVSSVSGEGIEELKKMIDKMVEEVKPHSLDAPFRLPVDRSFSLAGFGTVVTGTLLSGKIETGARVQLLPQDEYVRVRQIQVHGQEVNVARAGQRVALNLTNISPEDIPRGTEVVEPGYYHSTSLMDVEIKLLDDFDRILENRTRVHLHIGTSVVLARILLLDKDELLPGQKGFAQLKLEEEVVAHFQDRFIIRFYSPVYTIGGGKVLNPRPEPHRRFQQDVLEELNLLSGGRKEDLILQQLMRKGLARSDLLARETGCTPEETAKLLDGLLQKQKIYRLKNYYLHPGKAREWQEKIEQYLSSYHQKYPLRRGAVSGELKQVLPDFLSRDAFDEFLIYLDDIEVIKFAGDRIALKGFEINLNERQQKDMNSILAKFEHNLFSPPDKDNLLEDLQITEEILEEYLGYLQEKKEIFRVSEEIYFSRLAILEAQERLLKLLESEGQIDLGQFRDLLDTSRKYALPLLEFFDSQRVTIRENNIRKKGNKVIE